MEQGIFPRINATPEVSDPNSAEMARSKKRYTPHGDCHRDGNGNDCARARSPKRVEPTGASQLACARPERWDQGWVHDGGHRHRLSWGGGRGFKGGERVARRRKARWLGGNVDGIEHDVCVPASTHECCRIHVPTDAARRQHFSSPRGQKKREKGASCSVGG